MSVSNNKVVNYMHVHVQYYVHVYMHVHVHSSGGVLELQFTCLPNGPYLPHVQQKHGENSKQLTTCSISVKFPLLQKNFVA